MRAAVIHRYGGPNVLTVETVPVPRHNADEVLIHISAAGVGTWDPWVRSGGEDDGDTEFPLVLGTDGGGTVVAAGANVSRLAVGDRVYSYMFGNPKGGFYAEYVAMPASKVARVPEGLDDRQAGVVPAIGLTALQGVDDALEIADGEAVVIHGASGNVGMLAIQFAKLRGARVLAIASGSDGVELVRRLGADVAVDGKGDDVEAALKDFAPDGIDAVLAFVGGKDLTRTLDHMVKGGRLAYPNGIEHEPRKRRGLSITKYDAESGVRQFERLGAAIEQSKLEVPIAATFPLNEVARAHERVERGHLVGAVVLEVAPRATALRRT
ncbi:MAG TPA: NADP-dependent oxidoreductase [Gemmatimonadaceae bacterium]|nr:NADP-dependent oxidoreductase [Gemmatimonadaceae bacterium]